MRTTTAIAPEAVAGRLADLGFSLPENALRGLAAYLGLLTRWNKAMNLVGTSRWEETLDTLAVDSFYLADFLRTACFQADPVTFDLGAGAGLPGIPLRLVWREGTYTLVEAREKRALFLRTVLASIDLGRTAVFHGRAEDFLGRSGRADCLLSRAFMPWRDLLFFVEAALAPHGRVFFLTNEPAPEKLPGPWRLAGQSGYAVRGKQRFLWCLAKEPA